jgi:hypothetical protein
VIRPFDWRDAKLVTRLQQVGTPLDIEEQLTHPRSPLRSVLINSILYPRTGPSTFILDQQDEHGRLLGMAQMRNRPGRPEQDVVFMAPTLEAGNGNHAIWQRMLTHLCVQTAERGNFSLYANLPVNSEEYQLFKNVGFLEYSQEDIFQLGPQIAPQPAPHSVPATIPLRSQQSGDGWGLQNLYALLTPRQVQNAEGLAQGQWALGRHSWAEPGRREGYVWEEKGEILGAVHLHSGKRGFWIRTLLHPDALDQAEALTHATLELALRKNPNIPVYFALRQYEMGQRSTLLDLGFEPLTTQVLVVKPLTVRVNDKAHVRLPSLEKTSSEGAATSAISRTEIVDPKPTPSNGH